MSSEVAEHISRKRKRKDKWEPAVKVYTINHESRYLVVENVPALNNAKELVELFSVYGKIEVHKYLDDHPSEDFHDVYWIKYELIKDARIAKRKLDDFTFFGTPLKVRYGPEYETVADTRHKLVERSNAVLERLKQLENMKKNSNKRSRSKGNTSSKPTSLSSTEVAREMTAELDDDAINDANGFEYTEYEETEGVNIESFSEADIQQMMGTVRAIRTTLFEVAQSGKLPPLTATTKPMDLSKRERI